MTELFVKEVADVIFYAAPFIFTGAGFVLGWTLKEIRTEKKEKKND